MGININLNYKPHPLQKQVHQACDDEDIRFVVMVAGRQSGKSFLLKIEALKRALSKSKIKVLVVSPTDSQVAKLFDELYDAVADSGIVRSKSSSSGDMSITFTNKSTILFRSARSENNLRGLTIDHLLVDESSFLSSETYYRILLPMITTRPESKVLLCSTPNGRNNWFYSEYKMKSPMRKSFRFTYLDNPLADKKLIEEMKKSMTDISFRQEFLCEFIDGSTLFQNIRDCEIDEFEVKPSEKFYGAIDIGMVSDNTVFSVINEHGQLIEQDAFTGLQVNELLERLDQTYKKYNFEKVLVESNSYGLTILQLLREKWEDKVAGFLTTNKSKNQIISNLINAFSRKEIQFVRNEDLVEELNDFTYNTTASGAIQFGAISGKKDDRIMSLAIGWFCWNRRYSNNVPIQF